MKRAGIAITLLFVVSTTAAFAASAAQKSFEELKALDGAWEGTVKNGQPVEVDYRLTSGGSALMSEIKGKEDMITMFHMDKDRVLMTHYCGAGNQPRMQASTSPDGKTITFTFTDATNMTSPKAGHMDRLVITMPDSDHHTEDWTFVNDGKEMKEHFELARAQASM